MSCNAVDWATDSHVGSSGAKFILILLANKAANGVGTRGDRLHLMASVYPGTRAIRHQLHVIQCGRARSVDFRLL
jgi:hypothetical protein